MIQTQQCTAQGEWDAYVNDNGGHPLQLWGWGEVKAAHGWQADRLFVTEDGTYIGAAQLLIRKLPSQFRALVYIPRGPVVEGKHRVVVLDAIAAYAKNQYKATVLTIEPHVKEVSLPRPWRRSSNTILIPRTLILDLTRSTDELMADIHRKRRYDIRRGTSTVAGIHEVMTKDELMRCLELYKETAGRAGFALHGEQYYIDIFEKLGAFSRLVAAWNEKGEPIAFIWAAVSKRIAFDLYGGSNREGQQSLANYALKWWCIQRFKEEGVEEYDLNGLLNDGISHFKRSFASHEDQLVGTYDYPLSPLYPVWTKGLPAAKKIVRMIKR